MSNNEPVFLRFPQVMKRTSLSKSTINRREKEGRFPHLDPSAPNNFLRTLGYHGKLVSHGWRSVALTNGIDQLKTP